MSAKRSSTIKVSNNKNNKKNKKPDVRSKEYAEGYKAKFGEDYPEEVKDAPFRVVGRKIEETVDKVVDKTKKGAKKIYNKAKKVIGKKGGGALKPVPPDNKGLGKLPTEVRNNMGFYKKGGKVKRMSCPVDGMAKRGKTKVRRKGR